MALRLTKAGLEAKKKDLEKLKQRLNELQIFKGSVAIHSGDAWHDNTDFEQCEIDERRLSTQINDLAAEIASAQLIDDNIDSNIVSYGAKVLISLSKNGEKILEEPILFSDSDDDSEFISVSVNAPLGKAIYQKSENSSAKYTVDGNVFEVKILKIEY